jgi:hypothetical protein
MVKVIGAPTRDRFIRWSWSKARHSGPRSMKSSSITRPQFRPLVVVNELPATTFGTDRLCVGLGLLLVFLDPLLEPALERLSLVLKNLELLYFLHDDPLYLMNNFSSGAVLQSVLQTTVA